MVGLWWGKPILFIKVPSTINWLVAIHEIVQPLALPPVEVLHFERFLARSEFSELIGVAEELVRTNHQTTKRNNQLSCGVTIWLGDFNVAGLEFRDMRVYTCTHGCGTTVVNIKTFTA